jgi:hypothetical protein
MSQGQIDLRIMMGAPRARTNLIYIVSCLLLTILNSTKQKREHSPLASNSSFLVVGKSQAAGSTHRLTKTKGGGDRDSISSLRCPHIVRVGMGKGDSFDEGGGFGKSRSPPTPLTVSKWVSETGPPLYSFRHLLRWSKACIQY